MKRTALILMMLLSLAGCRQGGKTASQATSEKSSAKVQVLLFHAAQRCATCRAIEAATKEVLDADFAQQVKDGIVVLRDIDGSLRENEGLVDKYEVISTSIFVDDEGQVTNLTNDAFSYARTEPDRFKEILRSTITKALE